MIREYELSGHGKPPKVYIKMTQAEFEHICDYAMHVGVQNVRNIEEEANRLFNDPLVMAAGEEDPDLYNPDCDNPEIRYEPIDEADTDTEAFNRIIDMLFDEDDSDTNNDPEPDPEKEYMDSLTENELKQYILRKQLLIDEWDYIRNGNLEPQQLRIENSKFVWWVCSRCKHSYLLTIRARLKGKNCCICGGPGAHRSKYSEGSK